MHAGSHPYCVPTPCNDVVESQCCDDSQILFVSEAQTSNSTRALIRSLMCARTKRPPLALKRLPRPPSGVHMLLHAVAHRVRTFISCHWRLSAELISLHQASHVPHLPTARHTREVAAQVLQARAERCRANSSLPHTRCVPKICPPRHGPGSPCDGETSRHVRSSPPLHTPTTVIIILFTFSSACASLEVHKRMNAVLKMSKCKTEICAGCLKISTTVHLRSPLPRSRSSMRP